MSLKRTVALVCDSCGCALPVEPPHTFRQVRRLAQFRGWAASRNHDYCPDCLGRPGEPVGVTS